MERMSASEIIEEILQKHGLKAAALSKKLGYDRPQLLYDIKSGKTKNISKDLANKIVSVFPEYDKAFLLTGERGYTNNNHHIVEEPHIIYNREGYRNNGNRGVPYYDIDITATITESFNDVREDPEFYVDFKPFNDCSAYLPIWGDSMFPTFTAGDIVAIKRLNNPHVILWGEPHLVITGENANNMKTVKLLFPHPDDSKIILRASNPNFAGDTVINKEDICSIYIVKGKITRKQL
jgi:hypothetical protein